MGRKDPKETMVENLCDLLTRGKEQIYGQEGDIQVEPHVPQKQEEEPTNQEMIEVVEVMEDSEMHSHDDNWESHSEDEEEE